ncbi:energy transducer TonB [Mailhella massiliensis]|nr:energy transducer TonB [Mailhella massiliensis]
MSSALRCPMRMLYGTQERRRSRNMAVFGMFGMMSLLTVAVMFLHAERTLSLPSVETRRIFMMQAQFRVVPEPKPEKPDMEKIMTQESDFLVSEEPEPVAEKKPEPVKPEPKPEVKTVSEPEPKPEVKPAPRPKPEVKPKPVPQKTMKKAKVREKAGTEVSSEAVAQSPAGSSSMSMPGASGMEKAEKGRESEVLAVLLQAVEKHKRYPRQGRRSGAEGTCTLMVQVGGDGRVVSCTLAKVSGRSVLDAAAKRLGEKLVGLDVGSSGALKVLIPVHYRLTDR